MKGFKKDGKFRPTGNKSKSSLKKSDIRKDNSVDIEPNYLKKKPEFCSGKHKCPICKKTKSCTGGAFGHSSTKGQGVCHAKGEECFCENCQENRWDEVLEHHKNEGVNVSRNKKSFDDDEKELDRKYDEQFGSQGQQKEWQDDLDASEKSDKEFKEFFAKNKIKKTNNHHPNDPLPESEMKKLR